MRLILTLNGITVNVTMEKMAEGRIYDYDHSTNIVQLNEGHSYVRYSTELDEAEMALLTLAAGCVASHIHYCPDCLERFGFEPDADFSFIYGELLKPVAEQNEQITTWRQKYYLNRAQAV